MFPGSVNQGVFVLMDSMRNVMVHVCYQMIVLVNMVAFRMRKERRFILNARHAPAQEENGGASRILGAHQHAAFMVKAISLPLMVNALCLMATVNTYWQWMAVTRVVLPTLLNW